MLKCALFMRVIVFFVVIRKYLHLENLYSFRNCLCEQLLGIHISTIFTLHLRVLRIVVLIVYCIVATASFVVTFVVPKISWIN